MKNLLATKNAPANVNLLHISIALMIAVYGLAYYFRPITYDDAFFAEQAYWLHKLGYVKTVLFDGFLDWGNREYVYHKLHIWQAALLIDLFGLNVHILKLTPIFYLIIFLLVSRSYLNKLNYNKYIFQFFLFLILSNTFVIQEGLELRPEIMMMCTGFVSFYLLRANIIHIRLAYFLAGFFAGITALFHLNGLIFVGAGLGLLIYEKKYSGIIYFCLGAALSFSAYFFDMMSFDKIKDFYFQFTHDPAITYKDIHSSQWLLKVISGPKRFFEHGYEGFYTIFTFTILWISRRNITNNEEQKILFIYFILLELSLSLISPGSKSMYLVFHMPYLMLLVAINYREACTRVKKKYAVTTLFVIYVFSQLFHIYAISTDKTTNPDLNRQLYEEYKIKPTDKVLAPEQFVFNEVDNSELHGIHVYNLRKSRGGFNFSIKNIFHDAYNKNIRYIFLSEDYVKYYKIKQLSPQDAFYHYTFLAKKRNIYVFERQAEMLNPAGIVFQP